MGPQILSQILSRVLDAVFIIVGYNFLAPKFGVEVAGAYVCALLVLMPVISLKKS